MSFCSEIIMAVRNFYIPFWVFWRSILIYFLKICTICFGFLEFHLEIFFNMHFVGTLMSWFSVIFFLVYLLSHKVNQRVRQSLIVLCETHFALLYMLKLNLLSKALEHNGAALITEVLEQLGMYFPLNF